MSDAIAKVDNTPPPAPEAEIKKSLITSAEKFKTQDQIHQRIATVEQLIANFKKGERGIGTLKAERKILIERLNGMQNQTLNL